MSELKHLHSSVELNESRSGKEAVEVRHRRDGRDVTTIYGASVDPSAANGSVFEGVVPKSESARSLLDKALSKSSFLNQSVSPVNLGLLRGPLLLHKFGTQCASSCCRCYV